ncbi:hypothetical protein [Antarcticimicrobium luteum]|uniref:hypothetical protein n=1 Tax=Antarcticimicrobium luteum TaxID=2547397 RepID=UPI00140A5BD7|nr:hypothetical protein [Antarcticimicrobium luteum]
MITIYAQSFMTATRTGCVRMRGVPPAKPAGQRRRWLPKGHWWVEKSRCKDPTRL